MAAAAEKAEAKKPAPEAEKPVAQTREPLWSKTGLLVMVAVWLLTLGLGVGGVLMFMGTPSATDAPATKGEGRGAGRTFGLIERVQASLPDENNEQRTVSFNLLLDFGDGDEMARAELEQGNFKTALAYQAEELLRGYTVRQITERSFSRDFGTHLKRHLNELYSKDGKEYVREVLVQNLAVSR
ncbi:MAG: hypothetical protein IT463_09530 [Planctomycetes bacterium]|nr:hypothetical protein [Planctomycetota bacterium]